MKKLTRNGLSVFLAAISMTLPTLAHANDVWWQNQKYWDGKTSPPLKWPKSCNPTPAEFARNNPDYASPPLMAIGDSLYNGVQSLRINWWLSEWSAPTLVALRMGLIQEKAADRQGRRSFYNPQYEGHGKAPNQIINYGFNLERPSSGRAVVEFLKISSLLDEQAKALTRLKTYRPPNRRAMVDNIAFSGANTLDLLYWSPNYYQNLADEAIIKLEPNLIPNVGALGDAFSYGNAAFVLNPMRDNCLDSKTPLEQVELRRPKRLLVNIGANNGLYKVAFLGASVSDDKTCGSEKNLMTKNGMPHCVAPISSFLGSRYEEDMRVLLDRLSQIEGLQYVYVNNLVLPTQVANVVLKDGRYNINIRGNATVDTETIQNGNKLTEQANKFLKDLIRKANQKGGPKFVLVDMQEALSQRDFKGCGKPDADVCKRKRLRIDAEMSGTSRTHYLDNRPMRVKGDSGFLTGDAYASKLEEGGLFSFDNMHLSSIGYEIMAETVHNAMVREEGNAAWPLGFDGKRCVDPRKQPEQARLMRAGDCVRLLTKPGWSFVDATRRDFVFQRIASDAEMKNVNFIKKLMAFAN